MFDKYAYLHKELILQFLTRAIPPISYPVIDVKKIKKSKKNCCVENCNNKANIVLVRGYFTSCIENPKSKIHIRRLTYLCEDCFIILVEEFAEKLKNDILIDCSEKYKLKCKIIDNL